MLGGDIFYAEGGEVLEQVAKRSTGYSIPCGIQAQVGWGPGQLTRWGATLPVAEGLEWAKIRSPPTQIIVILWHSYYTNVFKVAFLSTKKM